MVKLLLCLLSIFVLAVALLQLRQQRLELNYQCNQLHNQIEESQAKLWSQQVQIAMFTAPNAISQTVGDYAIELAPPTTRPAVRTHWIDAVNDPDAE